DLRVLYDQCQSRSTCERRGCLVASSPKMRPLSSDSADIVGGASPKAGGGADGGNTVRAQIIKCLRRSVYELIQERGFRLRGPLLRRMESTLCTDFSDVVLHVSPLSCALNNFFGVQAFTIGNHICFSERTYDPRSDFGQRLLAHELAHVIQKRLGKDGIG